MASVWCKKIMNTLTTSAQNVSLKDAIVLRLMRPELVEINSDAYFYGKLDSLMDTLFQLCEPINRWEC